MEWLGDLKHSSVLDIATTQLGMEAGRVLNTFGPCPVCGAERRGSTDPRPPCGVTRDRRGWQCHACQAKGDVVELICQHVYRKSSAQMGSPDWGELHKWALDRRLISEHSEPKQKHAGERGRRGWQAPTVSVGSLLGQKERPQGGRAERPQEQPVEEQEADPGPSGGRFQYSATLAEECSRFLFHSGSREAAEAGAYLEARGLSAESCEAFRLGVYLVDNQPVLSKAGRLYLTIPLMDKAGKVVNIRFRSIPKVGTCEHCQSVTGCSKCKEYRVCIGRPLPLFGAHLLGDTDVPVLVTEGELDVVALHSYGYTQNVVSGTAGSKTFKDEWLDILEPYQNIIGLYDTDAAGEDGWKAFAEKIGPDKCSRATLPHKDAGECAAQRVPLATIQRCIEQAVPLHGMSFRKADDFQIEIEQLIDNPDVLRGAPTGSENLDMLLGGWRPGVEIITGETGQGKTTFATWALLTQAREKYGCMITSFEQQPIGTVQKLLRVQVGRDFTRVTREERADALGILGRLPLYILDHYGHIPAAKMVEAIRYAKRRLGVRFFLIDHLGFLLDPDLEDERRAIEAVIRALAILGKQLGVTIFLIVHPRNDAQPVPGRYQRVTMKQLKGASAIRQDADDVLVIVAEPPDTAKGQRVKRPWPQTRIYADKVRSEFGISGGDIALAYDPGSCTYADRWSDTPSGKLGLLVPRASPMAAREDAAESSGETTVEQTTSKRSRKKKKAAAEEELPPADNSLKNPVESIPGF